MCRGAYPRVVCRGVEQLEKERSESRYRFGSHPRLATISNTSLRRRSQILVRASTARHCPLLLQFINVVRCTLASLADNLAAKPETRISISTTSPRHQPQNTRRTSRQRWNPKAQQMAAGRGQVSKLYPHCLWGFTTIVPIHQLRYSGAKNPSSTQSTHSSR